jgi:dynein heavy chain
VVFHHAIYQAVPSENVKDRVENLIDSITYSVFMYTSRGLFERDKLTFVSQVAFQVGLLHCLTFVPQQWSQEVYGLPTSSVCLCV